MTPISVTQVKNVLLGEIIKYEHVLLAIPNLYLIAF